MVFPVIKLLVIIYICSRAFGLHDVTNESIPKEDMELERKLQFLNRTSVIKTIQLEEGDIIHCIDINKQPALDHPLLKNHKVQMRPKSFPSGMKKSFLASKPSQTRPSEEACPFGTVPIHRSLNYGGVEVLPLNARRVFLLMNRSQESGLYRGALGSVSVYNLSVAPDQYSSSNMWIENGDPGHTNLLVAGAMVSPVLYGDLTPRLFLYWEGEGKTGCFNTLCNGFVQVNRNIGPRYPIKSVSTYGGKSHDIRVTLFQEKHTGNWWLATEEKNVMIGYWPKATVPKLINGAARMSWGGVAGFGKTGLSPPVGSGHMPDGHYDHAAYFRQVHYIDTDFVAKVPFGNDTKKYVDEKRCYDLKDDQDFGSEHWGYVFTFGGPGGFCGH